MLENFFKKNKIFKNFEKFPQSFSFYPLLLILFLLFIYRDFFLFGRIPFPGDLLISSYMPWLEFNKLPVKNPLISDVFSQFYLWKYLAVDIIKSGNWPLWNPYSFMGNPLLGTYHSASLNPFNLFLLLPKGVGWAIFIIFQTSIALFSMYLFLKSWVDKNLACLIGAMIFSVGGLMTTWLEFGTADYAMAWLPLTLYSITAYFRKKKIRYLYFLTLTLSLTILSGHAQITIYSFIIFSFYSVFLKFKYKYNFVNLFYIFLWAIFSLLITSPQLLESYQVFNKSIRASDTYNLSNAYGLSPITDFLKIFIADFFGNASTYNYWGFFNYSETSSYAGALILPLFIYIILSRKKTPILFFFLFLLGISLLLAYDNPFSQLIYRSNIPLLASSAASRIFFIVDFCLAFIAAFAIDEISQSENFHHLKKSYLFAGAVFLGIYLGSLIGKLYFENLINHFQVYKFIDLSDFNASLKNAKYLIRPSMLSLGIILFPFALILIIKKIFSKTNQKLLNNLLIIFLTLAFFLDLSRYFLKFNPFVPKNYIFPNSPSIDYLKNKSEYFRIGRENAEVLPPNTWMAYNLQSIEGYDPIVLKDTSDYFHLINSGVFEPGNISRYNEVNHDGLNSPYIDIANVKYFIVIARSAEGRIPGELISQYFKTDRFKKIYGDHSTYILENLDALDRAFFAKKIIVIPDDKLSSFVNYNKDFNPKTTTILSKDLQLDQPNGIGQVRIKSYTENQVILTTNSDQAQILVLADKYDDGWIAQIDNQITDIAKANIAFRAIKVPAGIHIVTFTYQPKMFYLGLNISFLTLGLIFIISIFTLIKRLFLYRKL